MEGNHSTSNEEMDIIRFLAPLFRYITKLKDLALQYLSLLYSNKWIFLAILITGTAIGYCARYKLTPAIEMEGYFVSKILPNSYTTLLIQKLNKEVYKRNNKKQLAQKLQLSLSDVQKIKSIECEPLNMSFLFFDRDSSFTFPFKIILHVTDTSSVDPIQKAIVQYLKNSDFASKRTAEKIKYLLATKNWWQAKLDGLDSLKGGQEDTTLPANLKNDMQLTNKDRNIINVNLIASNFYQAQLKIENELSGINSIETVQPFAINDQYSYLYFNKILKYAFISSLAAALLLTPFLRKRIKKSSL